jgi:hypothetical protein
MLGAAAGVALVPYDPLFAHAPKLADISQFGCFVKVTPGLLDDLDNAKDLVKMLVYDTVRAVDKAGFQVLLHNDRYAPRMYVKQPGYMGTIDPVNHYGTVGLKVCAYRTIFPKNDRAAIEERVTKELYVNLLLHRHESEHARTRTLTQRDNHTSAPHRRVRVQVVADRRGTE